MASITKRGAETYLILRAKRSVLCDGLGGRKHSERDIDETCYIVGILRYAGYMPVCYCVAMLMVNLKYARPLRLPEIIFMKSHLTSLL
jgi:hypothetical protein